MKKDIQVRKKIAIKAAGEVGKILKTNFGRRLKVKSKGDRDLVTNIDKSCERAILKLVKKHFPKDGIISEESPSLNSASGYSWIIDPIDGTHNFVHRIDVFGVSIAVAYGDKVVLGLIYMPLTNELYIGEKGKGTYLNGKKITVSKRKLKEATLIYDSSIRFNKKPMLKKLGQLCDRAFNVRMFGSTVRSLSYVAEGKVEAEVEFNDKLWDFAAGLLLVEEAGGKCTDFKGKPWGLNTKRYIAANRTIHKDLLKMLKGA